LLKHVLKHVHDDLTSKHAEIQPCTGRVNSFVHLFNILCFSCSSRLIQEVHDLHAGIADLHGKLRQQENAIQHLLRTKSTLEQDLAIKNNSLFIDSDKVMGIRRTFTMIGPEKSSVTSVSFSHPRGLITV